ncbi:hypothetical protein [Gilvibacter sediminis]|uniref:hypothetical protein n=1 Tax=Gilvibacter sediminis TaxID=379071 RepID=UPI0023507DC2|nr:hypothetical protein [Gilvibacter sediminis]MDC7998539.1 hypothetical protein [Gilvibacter sediminis]
MRAAKKYLILLVWSLLLFSCKQEKAEVPVERVAAPAIDTIAPPPPPIKVAVVDGLHLRLAERLSDQAREDSTYMRFADALKFSSGEKTLLVPSSMLSRKDCKDTNLDDYLLEQSLGSPQIMEELNGFRPRFSAMSTSGKEWVFSRASDSLLVEDPSGKRYLMWQTDIRAANGLLHLLRPISSQSD